MHLVKPIEHGGRVVALIVGDRAIIAEDLSSAERRVIVGKRLSALRAATPPRRQLSK